MSKNTPGFDRNRTLAILGITLLLCLAGLAWEVVALRSALQWVDHTDEVIGVDRGLMRLMVDMETGVRGFLLTRDESFLDPYSSAQAKIPARFDTLNQLIRDDPGQQRRLDEVRRNYDEWSREIDPGAIGTARSPEFFSKNSDPRLQSLLKAKLDHIRAEQDELLSVENGLRNDRLSHAALGQQAVDLILLLILILTGATVLLLLRRPPPLIAQTSSDGSLPATLGSVEGETGPLGRDSTGAWRHIWHTWMGPFLMAAGFPLIALLLNLPIRSVVSVPFLLFVPAVCLVTRLKNIWWGLGSLAFSLGLVDYFLVRPFNVFSLDFGTGLALVLYACVQILLCWLIDGQKQSVKTLAAQSELLNRSHDGILVRDFSGQIQSWNQGAEEIYGYSRNEAEGSLSHTLLKTIFPKPLAELNADLIRAGRWEGELEHTTRDGRQVFVSSRWLVQAPRNGDLRMVMETNSDITAGKLAAEALRESEAMFRTMVQALPQMVWIMRPDGRNIFFSQQWMDYTGLSLEESLGHGWNRPFHPEDRQRALDAWQAATLNPDAHYAIECRLRRADGIYRWCGLQGVRQLDANGTVVKWCGTCTDIHENKLAKESTERMLQRLNEAQRIGQIGDWEMDLAFQTVFWSPQIYAMMGRDPALGPPSRDERDTLFDGPSVALMTEKLTAAISSGEPQNYEITAAGSGNQPIHLQARAQPRVDEQGRMTGVVGTVQDISERKEAEAELRQSEEKLRLLVDGVKDHAIIMLDAEGRVSSWNKGAENIKGFRAEEIVGRYFAAFYTPAAIAAGKPALELKIAEETGNFEAEGWRVRKDGSEFLANVIITALRDDTGRLRGFGKVTRDITARREAEEAANALLRTVHAHAIVSVTDRAGRILEVNDSFCAISGYSREELVGKTHRVINSGEHGPEFWTEMWRDISGGKSWRRDVCNRTKQGSLYWVDSIIAPFLGEDGQTTKFISIRSDITASKLSEESLREATLKAEQANRAKSEFLANMSHEIRTPMNAIMGMTHLAQRANPAPSHMEYLLAIAGASESLLRIIDDILDFSKMEAGKMQLEHIPFSVAALLSRVHEIVEHKARQKSIDLIFSVAPDPPPTLIGDPHRLEQILINLVNNALKFSDRGDVALSVTATELSGGGARLTFAVRDSGIGMTAEQVSRLFQSFSQADTSTTRKYGGTGLGLAITKQLCELMGGTLSVESLPDEGSTFLFSAIFAVGEAASIETDSTSEGRRAEVFSDPELPPSFPSAVDAGLLNPVAEPTATHDSARLRGRRVLLVEDNNINRRVATELLTGLGIQVTAAANGGEGVRRIQSEPFDLVLMDIQMPEMDGLTATRLIREEKRFRTLPILAMTAHAMSGDREKSLAAGMNDHLTKPIVPAKLTEALLRWMPASSVPGAGSSELLPPDLPPFDIPAALLRTNGKPRLLREILFSFRDQYRNVGADLLQLIREGKADDAERAAHSLKSVTATLEARHLAQAAAEIEAALRARQMEGLDSLIASLQQALEPAIAAVDRLDASIPAAYFEAPGQTDWPTPGGLPVVLVVDDEPITFALLRDTFEHAYEVVVAADGLAALEIAAARIPDLILLDVRMAAMDGFEVCSRLKANSATRDIPVIFITGSNDSEAEVRGLALGAIDYVTKPLHTAAVKARVDNQIALKRVRDKAALANARELARSYARFNSVLESTSDCIITISPAWTVLYANRKAAENLTGVKVGEDYWSCVPALLGTVAEQYQRSTMLDRTEARYEIFYPPDQTWYRVKTFPVDEGISIFFSDMTQEKNQQNQLLTEQLLREKRIEGLSHMAGGLAHEISNPLAIIHGQANELKSRANAEATMQSSEVGAACDSIVKTSNRAMKILRGLKGFARDSAQDPMELVSIHQIIELCLELQHGRLDRHAIDFKLVKSKEIPAILCREVQVQQILTNLLNNAIDAIVQSESVERWVLLAARYSERGIVIDVTDSGPGVEDHFRDHLMEPFFTTKASGMGMGIGLSLSRAIAEDHGGTLTLLRDTKNTCFRLMLPASADAGTLAQCEGIAHETR